MGKTVKDAEGVTAKLGVYKGVDEGPFGHRHLDVKRLLWEKITADTSLDGCPSANEIDPELWSLVTAALGRPVEDDSSARTANVSRLVADLRDSKKRMDDRLRQRRRRARRQGGATSRARVEDDRRAMKRLANRLRQQRCREAKKQKTRLGAMAGNGVAATLPVAEKAVAAAEVQTTAGETVDGGATVTADEAPAESVDIQQQDEHATPTEPFAGIDPLKELMALNITDDAAREAVQTLRSALLAAHKLETAEDQHVAVRVAIDAFMQTDFARQSREWLYDRGWALVPLFSRGDVGEKTSSMARTVEAKLLQKTLEGNYEIPDNFSAKRIKGQPRYMLDPKGRRYRRKLGEDFVSNSGETGETAAFVLQAIDYGIHRTVDVEKLTLLLSAAGKGVQVGLLVC